MPVNYDWYDKAQAIIICNFIGDWTLEELAKANITLSEPCQQVSGRFDIIADFTEARYTPPVGILWEWKQIAQLRTRTHSNWGLSVIIANSRIFDAFFKEGVQTSDVILRHYRHAQNVEAALQMIQADREAQKTHQTRAIA